MRQHSKTLGIGKVFSVPVPLSCLVITLIACLTALDEVQSQGDGKPLDESLQLVVVVTQNWEAVNGTLQRYERPNLTSAWRPVGPKIPVVVGRNGMGWGKGLHQNPSRSGPIKKEGDRKAPAGIFSLSQAFGYAPAESMQGLKLPYLELSQGMQCVDDTKSQHYNEIINANELTEHDWQSFEDMRRSDGLYRWGIVVDYNARPSIPGAGSCIFLHIWRGPSQGTSGCTAFEASQVEAMLHWLDRAAKPILVQFPTPDFIRLQRQWDLPDIP